MPRKKNAPASSGHLSGGRKPNERGAMLTSDRIASDLRAFENQGGHIEVLGTTRSLKRIDEVAASPAQPASTPAGKR